MRDLRLRWACEEAGFAYAVGTTDRPAFRKARADPLARSEAADAARAG